METITKARLELQTRAYQMILRTKLVEHPAFIEAARPLEAHNLQVRLGEETDSVYLMAYVYDLESFKDPRIVELLAHYSDWDARTEDFTAGAPARDFMFSRTVPWVPRMSASSLWLEAHQSPLPDRAMLNVAIHAMVARNSPSCRVEIVGVEETVDRKVIRRIVCDAPE
jgi:hypothetical protein